VNLPSGRLRSTELRDEAAYAPESISPRHFKPSVAFASSQIMGSMDPNMSASIEMEEGVLAGPASRKLSAAAPSK
jgi:hypothetical protein